jgi:CRISPR/Cas system-associated exonuclease Cas4 (RecB family)
MLKEVIEEIRRQVEEQREIEYGKGVGITALLYCPLKWEFRQRYPEIKSYSVEIDDGFAWELAVKEALKNKFGSENVEEEKVLLYKTEDGFTVEGHLDVYVKPLCIGIELKHTKLTLVDFEVQPDMEDIIETDNPLSERIPVNEHYLLQAKAELFLLRREDPDAEVRLWIKTTLKGKNGRFKKVIYEKVITEPMKEEEFLRLIRDFKEKKEPRYNWECRYCPYKGVCKKYAEVAKECLDLQRFPRS